MTRRTGLLALVALALAVLWWLAEGERVGSGGLDLVLGRESTGSREPAAELIPPDGARRERLPVAAAVAVQVAELAGEESEPLEPGESRLSDAGSGSEKVIVRVKLMRVDGSAAGFAGHEVTTQSWLEETGATTRHTARADEGGVATFEFPGFVHVDWFLYFPPEEAQLAFSLDEYHEDLAPGSVYEVGLGVQAGASIVGRIEHLDGSPAAGVEVHAYVEYFGDAIDSPWRAGVVQAASDAAGVFRFPNLPARDWTIGVPPFEWLQVRPDLFAGEATTHFDLAVGQEADAGVYRVVELERIAIEAVDEGGGALPGLRVALEPSAFAAPLLQLGEEEPAVERWMRGEDPTQPTAHCRWPYGTLAGETDEAGRLTLAVPAGNWELECGPALGSPEEGLRRAVTVPGPAQRLVFPGALQELEGLVVDEQGQPVDGALVELVRVHGAFREAASRSVGGVGLFRFDAVPDAGEYSLRARRRGFVPAFRVLDGATRTGLRLVLGRGAPLRVRLLEPGQVTGTRRLLVIVSEELNDPAARNEAVDAYLRELRSNPRLTERDGELELEGLPPGRYELGLMLPVPVEDPGGGPARTERRVWQTWRVDTREEPHELPVDLAGYVPPASTSKTRHSGIVRDAQTGAPLEDVRVLVRHGAGSTVQSTGEDGHFGLQTPSGQAELSLLKEGYEPVRVEPREYEEGEAPHEFRMSPGGSEVRLRFVDKDGEPLPGLSIDFEDPEGRKVTALVRTQGRALWRDRAQVDSAVLHLAGLAPGALTLRMRLFDLPLEPRTVAVALAEELQEITVALDESQDELRAKLRAQMDGE